MNQVIKTTEGYMVEMSNGDYACDAQGNNTWDSFNEARDVLFTLSITKQEQTAHTFGMHYAYVNPSMSKNWERKERHERFPVIAKGAKADIRGVLKRLTESADKYIDDGKWIDALSKDIADAKYILDNNL
jgi:hypothetical protein